MANVRAYNNGESRGAKPALAEVSGGAPLTTYLPLVPRSGKRGTKGDKGRRRNGRTE